jgi:hypothetical protein
MYPLPAAGPRPAPLPWASRLVGVAWAQLALIVLASAYVGLILALFASPRTTVIVANVQLLAVHGAIAAVILARRRGAAIGIASVSVLAWGVEALLWLS